MIAVVLILIAGSLLALALGGARAYAYLARWVASIGAGVALVVHLAVEGLQGGGAAGAAVDWPQFMSWLGGPVYRSDALAAGLGAWCLLLGGLCLLAGDHRPDVADRGPVLQPAASLLVITTLYSLVYTWDLRAFAAQMLLLLPLLWVANGIAQVPEPGAAVEPVRRRSAYSIGLGLGGLCIFAAVLIMGQITGGGYGLAEMSLAALTRLPLALIALGVALWSGLAPVTGWSAWGYRSGSHAALAQSLALGVPIAALLLRLQALLTAQGPAGSVPAEWSGFMSALAWAGGLTAIAAGAGTILAAGSPRWTALLAAHALGLVTWSLGLDTPVGRIAALVILLAFGAARVTLEISSAFSSRYGVLAAGFSLAAAPLTAGFVGVWLLAGALSQATRPSIAIVLLGAVILSACGTALHLGSQRPQASSRPPAGLRGAATGWVAAACGLALIAGGVAPGLWLPQVAAMAGVAGGGAAVALPWTGVFAGEGLLAPLLLLGLAAVALAGIGWLVSAWMGSNGTYAGVLLPTAISRLEATPHRAVDPGQIPGATSKIQNRTVPAPVWWLSLAWLEEGLWGFGAMLVRLGARAGLGLGRLEGRYQIPLALVLILVALLAVIR
jgi:hypothetical protein